MNPPRCSGPLVSLGGAHGARLPERIEGDLEDLERGLRIALALEVVDGRARVREAFVAVDLEGDPVLPTGLRELPWGTYCEALAERALWTVEETAPGSYRLTPIVGEASRILGAAHASRRQGGRRPVTPERLRAIAELYRVAIADPDVSSTAAYIADEEGCSESTARKLIMRAREDGYLGPTTPGRAGEADR